MIKIKIFFYLLLSIIPSFIWPVATYADSLSINANWNWSESSCSGTMNGQYSYNYGVASGDNLAVTLNNQSNLAVQFNVMSSGPDQLFTVQPGSSQLINFANISGTIFIGGTPVSSACSSTNGGAVNIESFSSVTLSCVSEGSNSQGLSYFTQGSGGGNLLSLFTAGSLIHTAPTNYSGSEIYVIPNVTSTTTFELRAGTSATARLLAQTTCYPPQTVTQNPPPGATTTTPGTTSPPATTTSTATTTKNITTPTPAPPSQPSTAPAPSTTIKPPLAEPVATSAVSSNVKLLTNSGSKLNTNSTLYFVIFAAGSAAVVMSLLLRHQLLQSVKYLACHIQKHK